MNTPKRIKWLVRAAVALSLAAFAGCSGLNTEEGSPSPSFAVSNLKGQARCSSDDSAGWHALRVGDRLRAGCMVETPADLDNYMDISLLKSITVRLYPSSLVRITDVRPGPGGAPASAAVALGVGHISVRVENAAACEVAFTNGIARISGGLASLYGRGDVDALRGAALVTVAGQSEPTKVSEGYRFESISGKMYSLANFR